MDDITRKLFPNKIPYRLQKGEIKSVEAIIQLYQAKIILDHQ